MSEVLSAHEADVVRLLSAYHGEAKMSNAFSLVLQNRTREIVAGRAHRRTRRRAMVAVAAAAAAVAGAVLLWHPFGSQPTRPHVVRRAAPAAVAERKPPSIAPNVVEPGVLQSPRATAERPKGAVQPTPAVIVKRHGEPIFAVIAARPPAQDETGRALAVGDRLPAGASVSTGKGGRLTLITRRASEFTLNQNTELALDSRESARLRGGEIYCRSREHEIKVVDTAAGRIQLLGTVVDAAAQNSHRVAVTVISGKVRLANEHGTAVVSAGKRALVVASAAPTPGAPANIMAETAWYDGRGTVLSDFGDIAYQIRRGATMMTEIWAMGADGANKHRVKSYVGYAQAPGPWLPGQQWLLVGTHSALWTTPDFQAHRAHAGAGHPIAESGAWLLNAASRQDVPFQLPKPYDPLYMEISPDATRLAFCGRYTPDPADPKKSQGGVWVYDLQTGEMKRFLDGWIKTPVSWAPDSRRLVASTGEGYGSNYPLVVVDADTGEVSDLKVQGAGARFSPDGSKLAYCGDFKRSGSWSRGVLTTGSIFVIDLGPGGEARRISPEGEGALKPRWSPDGTRVAYDTTYWNRRGEEFDSGYAIFVAPVDGAGAKKVYEAKGGLSTVSWAPSGDALYIVTDQGVLLVATDGSGVRTDLGGSEKDSILPPAQRAQTAAALEAVREAIFQYAVGNVRSFEGRPADARAAFQVSADIFAGLPWRYPAADFSTSDVLRYADKAADMAARPAKAVIAESCKERMSYAGILLSNCAAHAGHFPPDLAALEQWSLSNPWGINWLSNRDAEWVKMIFKCPHGRAFVYTPPPAGEDPRAGDVLLTCPDHPDCHFVWGDEQARQLAWRRQAAARQAREKDPELKSLYDKAVNLKWSAGVGLTPWKEVEDAYLAVLTRTPNDPNVREDLGRMYTRWGRYQEALPLLASGPSPWSDLNRAFCLDALGKRGEAVAIYGKLAESPADSSIGAWARLGLNGPTRPRDLDVHPNAGEARLLPTPAWHASASANLSLTKPEGKPEFAIDGNEYTRWHSRGTDHGQSPGVWFQLDLETPLTVSRIVVDHQGRGTFFTNDWPRGLDVTITSDGTTWQPVAIMPAGPLQPAEILLEKPQSVRGVRFAQTATHDPEGWSIHEIYVFGPER